MLVGYISDRKLLAVKLHVIKQKGKKLYNLDKVCASCCCMSHGNQFILKCKLLYTGKYKNPFYICRFGSFCQWAYYRLSKFSFVILEYNAMSEEFETG